MGLQDLLASDMSVLLNTDEFGSSATYVEPSGAETELTVVLYPEATETPESNGIKTKKRIRECSWSAATLSDVNRKATLRISGVDWSIAEVVYADEYQIGVRLERHELHEHTRPNYRRT